VADRINAYLADHGYTERDPRYRYYACAACQARFHWTTERMGDGKFHSARYQPTGPGSQSGKPRTWVLRDERAHNQRQAAKRRAWTLYTNHLASTHDTRLHRAYREAQDAAQGARNQAVRLAYFRRTGKWDPAWGPTPDVTR